MRNELLQFSVGKTIWVNEKGIVVCGVIKEKGDGFPDWENERVIVEN